jgi:hypothetical protein
VGHLKRKLILNRKDQNDQSEKSSEETAQAKRVKEVILIHMWLSDIKAL